MKGRVTKLKNMDELQVHGKNGPCLGQIVQICENGRAKIDYPGNSVGPLVARSIIDMPESHDDQRANIPVLIIFENEDPLLPIIVGIVRDTLFRIEPSKEIVLSPGRSKRDVVIDGEKMIIDAKQEIVLRCGKSSITLRKDGKIVLKGIQITSRAAATNKIKGGAVSIN